MGDDGQSDGHNTYEQDLILQEIDLDKYETDIPKHTISFSMGNERPDATHDVACCPKIYRKND